VLFERASSNPNPNQIVTKLFHIVEPDVAVFGRKVPGFSGGSVVWRISQ
jgi:hypothetical protein